MKSKLFVLVTICTLLSCSNESNTRNGFEFNFPSDCCVMDQFEVTGIDDLDSENLKLYNACVFAPDGFTVSNNYFIQTNDEIETINRFEITDAIGNSIFIREDFSPNDSSFGWDGRINQIPQEGAFKVSVAFTTKNNIEVSVSYIICALNCQANSPFLSGYEPQGLNFNNLRWPNQHDGVGGFDSTAPALFCQ